MKHTQLRSRPAPARHALRLLAEAKKKAGLPKAGEVGRFPFGLEANRKSLELAIQYAVQQRLIPRAFRVDELFNDVTRNLGW
jgi:4,5-dihydroxyphthalate decarboxylase